MTLDAELDARREEAGPVYLDRIATAARQLADAGVPGHAKRRGDPAPDFVLGSAAGEDVILSDLLRDGPVVVSFFRGEWCPFCEAEIDALLAAQPEMASLGATLLMISPEPASDGLLSAVGRLDRTHLLHDGNLGVALRYGLVYLVPTTLRQFYLARDFDLARELSGGSWLLPLPADFIIGSDGTIVLSFLDPDFTRRLDPRIILETLARMRHEA